MKKCRLLLIFIVGFATLSLRPDNQLASSKSQAQNRWYTSSLLTGWLTASSLPFYKLCCVARDYSRSLTTLSFKQLSNLETHTKLAAVAQSLPFKVSSMQFAPNFSNKKWAAAIYPNTIVTGNPFNHLSEAEQAGILAHEYVHLKEHHALIKVGGYLISPFIALAAGYGFNKLSARVIDWFYGQKERPGLVTAAHAVVSYVLIPGLLSFYLNSRLAKYCEYRADVGADQLLSSSVGLISFLERLKPLYDNTTWKQWFYQVFYAAHPLPEVRIDYLQSISPGNSLPAI